MSKYKDFGIELKKCRNSIMLRQVSIVGLLGISISTYKNWELGISIPTHNNMRNLVDLLNDFGADTSRIKDIYKSVKDLKYNNEKSDIIKKEVGTAQNKAVKDKTQIFFI